MGLLGIIFGWLLYLGFIIIIGYYIWMELLDIIGYYIWMVFFHPNSDVSRPAGAFLAGACFFFFFTSYSQK